MAREGYRTLVADFPTVPEYQMELANSHHMLGWQFSEMGKGKEAEEQYRQALVIKVKLVADFPDSPVYRQQLAKTHVSLGVVLNGFGNRVDAEGQYVTALAILQRNSQSNSQQCPNIGMYSRQVMATWGLYWKAIVDRTRRSSSARRLPFKKNSSPSFRSCRTSRAAFHQLQQLGDFAEGTGKRSEAEEQYGRALEIRQKLVADFPAVPSNREQLANCHGNLGALLYEGNKHTAAEVQYRYALAIQERLVIEFSTVPGYRMSLAMTHNNLGIVLRALDKPSEAEVQLRSFMAIVEKLVNDFPAVPGFRQSLAVGHGNLGNSLARLGKIAEAEQQYCQALAIQERLVAEFPGVPRYRLELEIPTAITAWSCTRVGVPRRA